jgi:radical SAM protein with 4Fe4S-binding SPASM domain
MNESGFYSPSLFREKGKGSSNQSFAIEVVQGQDCQLNCEVCYKQRCKKEDVNDGRIPKSVIEDFINQAKAQEFKEIVFIGGEPRLHPDIFELIRYVRENGLDPILCTNGIAFSKKETAEKLEGTDTTVVTHAYFPNGEEVIDEFSGKRGYAQILKRAIENLSKVSGTKVILEMPLGDTIYGHAFDFFKYCRESGVTPFIEISRRADSGVATTSVTPEMVSELFEKFKEYDNENFPELADANISPPAYGNKCTMSITGLHVKNAGKGDYGKVYSCCSQGVVHGDLLNEPLGEIMRSQTLAVFREQDKYIVGPCKDCDIYSICKGGCRGEAYLKFGCPRASSPSCSRISEVIRNDIKLMAPESCEDCPLEKSPYCSLKIQT